MKKIIFAGLCCWMWQSLYGQNNAIFEGGAEEGHARALFSQSLNNAIFGGNEEDGHAQAGFSQSLNSQIFWGGTEDGHAQAFFSQSINSRIFFGGLEDGFAWANYAQESNNGIFGGGIQDGHSLGGYALESNNSIFAGGINDGAHYLRIEGLPASLNPIFAVELLSFEAWPEGNQVHLEWVTASEVNHDYFQVERSQDTRISEVIGLVWGQGGRQQVHAYSLKDPEPLMGYSFYRLQSFDKNGSVEHSSWVEVFFEPDFDLSVSIFPNPTAGELTVKMVGEIQATFELEMYDMVGRPLGIKKIFDGIHGQVVTNVNLAEFPVGIYSLRVLNRNNGKSQAYRVKVFR